jgi:putative ABC transport system permease protein
MVLFDIQTDQKEAVRQELKNRDFPILQDFSIVTMRLQAVNDRSVYELRQDTTAKYENWALNAELRVTYRAQTSNSETVIAGKYRGKVQDTIFVSVAEGYREAVNLNLGDKLTFNVQGILMETYVSSVREINWQDIQPNFLVVFPEGVLEEAPQFSVLVTRLPDAAASAEFQRVMVNKFPGVSIIDLKVIIETLENVLDQIAFVIQFMSIFTIATGIIILIGSLNISRLQRINEALLLRTIGARQYLIKKIMFIEYLLLGVLSAGLGIVLSVFTTWALFYFVFKIPFSIPLTGLLLTFIALTILTISVGSLGNRRLFNRPPLEVLRVEA